MLGGRFPDALRIAHEAFQVSCDELSMAYLAAAYGALGHVTQALESFATARNLGGHALRSGPGLWEAELLRRCGNSDLAWCQLSENRKFLECDGNLRLVAMCDAAMGRIYLAEESDAARQHLTDARAFGDRSGEVQVQLRCYQLATEIFHVEKNYSAAHAEAEAAIHLADGCEFLQHAVDLRLIQSQVYLNQGNAKAALQRSSEAVRLAERSDCSYAWGIADALHLCGLAHDCLGNGILANESLDSALAWRRQLRHPGTEETQKAILRIQGRK
jgi:tetratricopeptide (TPR) repeat protein